VGTIIHPRNTSEQLRGYTRAIGEDQCFYLRRSPLGRQKDPLSKRDGPLKAVISYWPVRLKRIPPTQYSATFKIPFFHMDNNASLPFSWWPLLFLFAVAERRMSFLALQTRLAESLCEQGPILCFPVGVAGDSG